MFGNDNMNESLFSNPHNATFNIGIQTNNKT